METINEKKGYLLTMTNSLLYLRPAYLQSTLLAVFVPPFVLITYQVPGISYRHSFKIPTPRS